MGKSSVKDQKWWDFPISSGIHGAWERFVPVFMEIMVYQQRPLIFFKANMDHFMGGLSAKFHGWQVPLQLRTPPCD